MNGISKLTGLVYLYKNISFIFSNQKNDVYKLIMASLDSLDPQSFFDVPITIRDHHSINTLKIVPIYDGIAIVGHIIIVEDVTEYYNLQKKSMLSDNLSSIGLLAAGVGHEINNSLEIVFNYLRYIKTRISDDGLEAPVGALKEELDFISQIVSRLVTFSDTSITNTEEFDVNVMIDNYIQLIRRNDIFGDTTFSIEKKNDPVVVSMNKNELRQVLINLIKNACEATGTGGTVNIVTSESEKDGLMYANIEIEDDGPELSLKSLTQFSRPFTQQKSSDSKNLGLGLSLCYSIITKNGGTIKAENRPDKGCRFTVVLSQGKAVSATV